MASYTNLTLSLPQTTLGDKKYIYGTYIEMAFHNLFLNMQYIYRAITGKDIMSVAEWNYQQKNPGGHWSGDFADEYWVWNNIFCVIGNCPPEDRLRAEELIDRHFPMMEAVRDYIKGNSNYKNLDSLAILKRVSQSLRELRNAYSHFHYNPSPTQAQKYSGNEKLVAGILCKAFIGAKRIVKTRFAFGDNEMRCAEQYKIRCYKGRNGAPQMKKTEIPSFKYRITEQGNNHLTVFGLVLFCSLFLEKKYAKILSDKAMCIPSEDQPVICEMISVYRLRLNSEKIYVTKTADALALDMLTELRRCPKELFELLPPELQHKFRVKVGDAENEDVLLLRCRDRFPHLVMRYIDETKQFDHIRFQVSLGRYFFRFNNGACIDNASRVRALSKPVHGFGRLTDIDASREAVWGDTIRKFEDFHKNAKDEKPYITDQHPCYVVNGNRIAMHIFEGDERSHIPELKADGVRNLVPTCWMSTYELPAMAFLMHLRGGAFVEDIIRSVVANYRKLFSDVANRDLLPVDSKQTLVDILAKTYNGISLDGVPQDMQNYLLGKTSDARKKLAVHAEELIKTLIEQTIYKQNKFERQEKQADDSKKNKLGKKNYVSIQPGRLAAFLAKDIMFFQPNDAENKGKLTSLNFRILQSTLALYNGDIETLKRVLTSAHIIGKEDDDRCNPVVMRMFSSISELKSTADFYKNYLEARSSYLKECQGKDAVSLHFVYANRMRWQEHDEDFYRAKASRYLKDESNGITYEKAIELPRGIFDESIRKELMNEPCMATLVSDESKNMAYIIYGYLKNVLQDDAQAMYESERTYPILNTLYREDMRAPKCYRTAKKIREMLMRNSNTTIYNDIKRYVCKLSTKEEKEGISRKLKAMKDNETTLKRFRVQDIIMFLIAKDILKSSDKVGGRKDAMEKIHLKDVQNGNVLEQPVQFSVQIQMNNKVTKLVKQDDLKLKDYAKFYNFLSDRRLKTLLFLVWDKVIDRKLLEQELEGYDKVHPGILKQVFDFEKWFVNTNGPMNAVSFSQMMNSNNYSSDSSQLIKIRNSFAHYSYPLRKDLDQGVIDQVLPQKAEKISDSFCEKICAITKINQN